MNAEMDPGEADPAEPCPPQHARYADPAAAAAAGPWCGSANTAATGLVTGPPADLTALYRDLMAHRQAEWSGALTGSGWGEGAQGIGRASRQIRRHPYWRTLPDPAAVARVARELRELGRQDPDGGPPAQPFRPVHLEQDRTFRLGPKDPRVRRTLARDLDEAGLWDDLDGPERRAEREFVEQNGCFLRYGLVNLDRYFFADSESMADFGVLSQLDLIAPALAAAGVALDVLELGDPFRAAASGGEEYVLEINGLRCAVWSAAERRAAARPLRYEAMMRPFIVINELLEAAGSRERCYVDPEGDTVYLLPQQVRAVLIAYRGYDERSLVLADRSVWADPRV